MCVFDGVNNLSLERVIHVGCGVIDATIFLVLADDLLANSGSRSIRNCREDYRIDWHHVGSCSECQIKYRSHDEADMPMGSSSWCCGELPYKAYIMVEMDS